jgi:hypothetical protein
MSARQRKRTLLPSAKSLEQSNPAAHYPFYLPLSTKTSSLRTGTDLSPWQQSSDGGHGSCSSFPYSSESANTAALQ